MSAAKAQEQALIEAFKKFDVNNDGKMQTAEFNSLLVSLGGFQPEEIQRLFAEADIDHSGELDWREFVKWICGGVAPQQVKAQYNEGFQRVLKYETASEAQFVQSAGVNKRIGTYLEELNQDKAEADTQKEFKRKQNMVKRAAGDEKEDAKAHHQLDVGPEYQGYRLSFPVTKEGADGLLQHYIRDGMPLHPIYANQIISEFTRKYSATYPKPVVHVQTPPNGRCIVVGDTHGQLADVLHIFCQLGPPSDTNMYVINGDIADRGAQACEIFFLLMCYFLADPGCIVINRGNHENEDMNAMDADEGGGFFNEVTTKYSSYTYRRFINAFKSLTLCDVINKEVFVVHGGLSRLKTLDFDYIDNLPFHDMTAPHTQSTKYEDQVFSDLIWSDPTETKGKYKSDRGIGIKFGPDITRDFCFKNRLRFVIRSHQLPEDGRGFQKMHEGRCVTVFSASNYCGSAGNYGAVLTLETATFPRYDIYEHYAAPLEELRRQMGLTNTTHHESAMEISQGRERANRQAVARARMKTEEEKMIVRIIEKKPDLWGHLINVHAGHTMDLDVWVDMCQELVDPHLPWAEAAKTWALVDVNEQINVARFLSRWVVCLDMEQYTLFLMKAVKSVFEAILSMDSSLEETVKFFDRNKDGHITVQELREVLNMFDLGLTSSQVDRLVGHMLHASKDSRVKVQDFLSNFAVVYKQAETCTESAHLEPWMIQLLEDIGRCIVKTPSEQLLNSLEIHQAATKIQKNFRGAKERKELDKSDKANGKALKGVAQSSAVDKAGQKVSISAKMVEIFRALDHSGDGHLQTDELVGGLEKIPGIYGLKKDGEPIARSDLMALVQAVDKSGNGTVNYLEFLQAFSVEEQGASDLASALKEDITTVLFRHRSAIRQGCLFFDTDNTGMVTAQDFMQVLNGVNMALSKTERTFTTNQISTLAEAMIEEKEGKGKSKAGEVNYAAFIKSFVIKDTENENFIVKKF